MPLKTGRKASFSLVEALMAMTILGLAVSGIMTSYSSAVVAGKISEDHALVYQLMERLKAQVRIQILTPYEVNSGTFTDYPQFRWQVNFYTTNITDLYQVDMIVAWRRGNKDNEVVFSTYHYFAISTEEITTTTS